MAILLVRRWLQHPNNKHKHWRGFQGVFVRKRAPVLEFIYCVIQDTVIPA